MLMDFIKWFKQSLEDNNGQASYRRIFNWILTCLIIYVVIWVTTKNCLTMLYIYLVIVLVVAIFLNTAVITTDNILTFFNPGKNDEPQQPQQPIPAKLDGQVTITPQKQ